MNDVFKSLKGFNWKMARTTDKHLLSERYHEYCAYLRIMCISGERFSDDVFNYLFRKAQRIFSYYLQYVK